ncbi:MAG: DUF4878 domain-containing protein [Thiovulaceae bacterium]|nr:DUF4878 domain-containing protein [Sulfurimonadaceae bacterium]
MKVYQYAFVLPFILLLTACSNPTEPAEVAEAFLTELADADIEDAKVYASPDTEKLLDLAMKFGQTPKHKDFTFTLVEEKIKGDMATVIYTNYQGTEKPVHLKRIDGKWKVHEKKQ